MWVQKLKSLEITCPNCGSKINISNDEYLKYRKETEDYYGSTVTCQRYLTEEDKFKYNGKHYDIEYTNMDCPVCKHYISITVSNGCDSDVWGFVYSNNVKPIYDIPSELSLEDYLHDNFFGEETSENESN